MTPIEYPIPIKADHIVMSVALVYVAQINNAKIRPAGFIPQRLTRM
jgi:hypothetical protein